MAFFGYDCKNTKNYLNYQAFLLKNHTHSQKKWVFLLNLFAK